MTHLSCWRIPNTLCRYSLARRWRITPLLMCGLHKVTSFPRVQCRKGIKYVRVEKPDKLHLSSVFKVNINNGKLYRAHVHLIRCDENDTLSLQSSSPNSQSNHEKNIGQIPVEGHCWQNRDHYSLKLSKSSKTWKAGETGTANIRMLNTNVIWCPGLDLGTEKRALSKNKENLSKWSTGFG